MKYNSIDTVPNGNMPVRPREGEKERERERKREEEKETMKKMKKMSEQKTHNYQQGTITTCG